MAITKLIIYNSGSAQGIVSAAIAANMYPYDGNADVTIKDLAGITTGDITTYIGTLTANSLDRIVVGCDNCVTAATGVLTKTQMGLLMAKLKTANLPTAIDSADDATTYTTNTIGKTGKTWATNEHAGRWVYIDAGTGSGQLAKIASNNGTVLTIVGTFDTTPDNTSDFTIYDPDSDGGSPAKDFDLRANGTTGSATFVWDDLYPGVTPPHVAFLLGDTRRSVIEATADSVTDNTLVDSGAFVASAHIGHYVFVYSSTLGKYQVRKIISNTANALTLDRNWDVNPTGTIVYHIHDDGLQVGWEKYVEVYVNTYLKDLTKSTVNDTWMRILDMNQDADELKAGETPSQDFDFIKNEMVAKGKIICDYLATL